MVQVGDAVKTPYGNGVVVDLRRNQVVVQPTTWHMDGDQKATFYLTPSDVTALFKVGDIVRTTFGVGTIVDRRATDGLFIVHMNTWKLAGGSSPVLYLEERAMRLEPPSPVLPASLQPAAASGVQCAFSVGEVVRTPYGSGVVEAVRADGVVIVRPNTWALDRNKIPTFYMNRGSVTANESQAKKATSSTEKQSFDALFAAVKQLKEDGNRLFKEKLFVGAQEKYAQAIDQLNVLGDTATDEQRSHLFEQSISCHNNLGVCCLRLQRYAECFNVAKSSLFLIDAFESLYPNSKLWQHLLNRDFSIETLLKVWKKKALFLMGKSSLMKQDYDEAVKHLEHALKLIIHDPKLASEAKELTDLISQANIKLSKQIKSEKDMWKKAFSKQNEEETAAEKIVEKIAATGNVLPLSPTAKSDTKLAKKSSVVKKKVPKPDATNGGWTFPTVLGVSIFAAAALAGFVWLKSRKH